jgi:hypothetical protein
MNDHVASEGLAAYADGRLRDEARARVEAHLSRCRECRQELAEAASMLASRERIPDEFLRRALKAGAGDGRVVRRFLPLRQAFGIAAVFVVVVLIGAFFLGRGGAGIATKTVTAVSDRSLPAEKKAAPTSSDQPAAPAEKGEAEAGKPGEEAFAKAPAAAAVDAKRSAPPAPQPVKEERLADEEVARARLEQEAGVEGGVAGGIEGGVDGGVVGGVIGGVATQAEKDKAANEARKTAAPPLAELQQAETAAMRATAQAQAKGSAQDQRRQARHGPNAENAANVATQMLLMVNSQAASPPAFAPGTMPRLLRIAGDVGRDDLLDPGPLDGWDWLGAGRSLELRIAADGTVQAAAPLGDWEPAMAARAQAAAQRLLFSASERPARRAVLSAGAGPN